MKQLFLTSTVAYVAHDIAKKVDFHHGNKLVFITTTAEPRALGDLTWQKKDRQSLVDVGFDVTDYTITGRNAEEIREDFQPFQFIYMSGGDTTYLQQRSQESGFTPLIKELVESGKTYISTSAGSIITGPYVPDYLYTDSVPLAADRKGYEFVNFTILPHWGSEGFREKYLGRRLNIAYRKDQVPLLLLTDTQYVHIRGEKMEIVDVNLL